MLGFVLGLGTDAGGLGDDGTGVGAKLVIVVCLVFDWLRKGLEDKL